MDSIASLGYLTVLRGRAVLYKCGIANLGASHSISSVSGDLRPPQMLREALQPSLEKRRLKAHKHCEFYEL